MENVQGVDWKLVLKLETPAFETWKSIHSASLLGLFPGCDELSVVDCMISREVIVLYLSSVTSPMLYYAVLSAVTFETIHFELLSNITQPRGLVCWRDLIFSNRLNGNEVFDGRNRCKIDLGIPSSHSLCLMAGSSEVGIVSLVDSQLCTSFHLIRYPYGGAVSLDPECLPAPDTLGSIRQVAGLGITKDIAVAVVPRQEGGTEIVVHAWDVPTESTRWSRTCTVVTTEAIRAYFLFTSSCVVVFLSSKWICVFDLKDGTILQTLTTMASCGPPVELPFNSFLIQSRANKPSTILLSDRSVTVLPSPFTFKNSPLVYRVGQALLAVSQDTIVVYDTENPRKICRTISIPVYPGKCFALHPDGLFALAPKTSKFVCVFHNSVDLSTAIQLINGGNDSKRLKQGDVASS